jgi:hypothetical protein
VKAILLGPLFGVATAILAMTVIEKKRPRWLRVTVALGLALIPIVFFTMDLREYQKRDARIKEVSYPSSESERAQSINAASIRWKEKHHIADFYFLKNELNLGVSVDEVERLLGDPNHSTQDDGTEIFEYIGSDDSKQVHVWNAIFDTERKLIRWAQ